MHKIVLAEDDPVIQKNVVDLLSEHNVISEADGSKIVDLVKLEVPSLVILDVIMPGKTGWEICKILRQHAETRNIPIIFLTSQKSMDDKTKGFQLGADDYITKPFNEKDLELRVKAKLKFAEKGISDGTFKEFGAVRIDFLTKQVFISDKEIELSSNEFSLLNYLSINDGKQLEIHKIKTAIWGESEFFDDNTVRGHIKLLLIKIPVLATHITSKANFYTFNSKV
jgi:DNA-binding response OmpR family regulator